LRGIDAKATNCESLTDRRNSLGFSSPQAYRRRQWGSRSTLTGRMPPST
jgi:hypothetical protein